MKPPSTTKTISFFVVLLFAEILTHFDATTFGMLADGWRLLLRRLTPDAPIVDAMREAAYAVLTLLMVIALGSFIGSARVRKAPVDIAANPAGGAKTSNQLRSGLRQFLGSRTSSCDSLGSYQADDGSTRSVLDQQTPETKLLAKMVRDGKGGQIPKFLDSAFRTAMKGGIDRGLPEDVLTTKHLLCVLRACVAHRCFAEALNAYDHVADRIVDDCLSIWSILLFCAIESESYARCGEIVTRLRKHGTPSSKDFVNMTRYYAHEQDVLSFQKMLEQLKEDGFKADSSARCNALLVCASLRSFDHADVLLRSGVCGARLDTITCNMLMSGFVQAKEPERCFAIWQLMRQAELVPSEQTFGILLNACSLKGQFEHAKGIFEDLRRSGLSLNVVHYTSLMKNLLRAGLHEDAMRALDEMQAAEGVEPDIVAYSTLIKAFADRGGVNEAVGVLERMIAQGIPPTVVIFNTVLGACASVPQAPQQVSATLEKLVSLGLKPSTATLSILVRALAKAKNLNMALDMLDNAPARFGLWAEARVYTQLAQAAMKMGNKHLVVTAYASVWRMAKEAGVPLDSSTNDRMLSLCQACGEGRAAVAIMLEEARRNGRELLRHAQPGQLDGEECLAVDLVEKS